MFMCCLNILLLQRLVAGLSPPGFDLRSVHMGFVADKMALRKVMFSLLRFSPFSIILLSASTHSAYMLLLPRGQRGKT
jgi:hypothetical protein